MDDLELVHASHVGRRWRTVAVTAPSLWHTARLTKSSLNPHSHFQATIQRSAATSLSIIAHLRPSTGPDVDMPLFDLLLRTLSSERRRIQALDLRVRASMLPSLSTGLQTGLPRLSSMHIHVDRYVSNSVLVVFYKGISSSLMPALRRITITGVELPHNVRVSSVTDATVQSNAIDAPFQSFPNLKKLSVQLDYYVLRVSFESLRTMFAGLEVLRVHRQGYSCSHRDTTCVAEAVLFGPCTQHVRHVQLDDAVCDRSVVVSALFQTLSGDGDVHVTLSDAQRTLRPDSDLSYIPPPFYHVHALGRTTGRSRAITTSRHAFAVTSAVPGALGLDGCGELTVAGWAGWKLLCVKCGELTLSHVHTLRIVLARPALSRLIRKQNFLLRLPALRTLILRGKPGCGDPIPVDCRQLSGLFRRLVPDPSASWKLEVIGLSLCGDITRLRMPANTMLDYNGPVVIRNEAITNQPVDDPALNQLFSQ